MVNGYVYPFHGVLLVAVAVVIGDESFVHQNGVGRSDQRAGDGRYRG